MNYTLTVCLVIIDDRSLACGQRRGTVGIITYFELANLAASSFGEVKFVFSDDYWTFG